MVASGVSGGRANRGGRSILFFQVQIGGNAGEQHRTAILIKYGLAAAADRYPFAPLIERAVFGTVRSGAVVLCHQDEPFPPPQHTTAALRTA